MNDEIKNDNLVSSDSENSTAENSTAENSTAENMANAENLANTENTDDVNDYSDDDDYSDDSISDSSTSQYNMNADKEAIEAIKREWKEKNKNKKASPFSVLLMLAVLIALPWYAWSFKADLEYFFSSSTPTDLGYAQDYRISETGTVDKTQSFEDNRYSTIRGIPIRQVAIKAKDSQFAPAKDKVLYQLLGSSVYIQEDIENSRFAQFMSKTSKSFEMNDGVEEIEISGRLRRFDTADDKKYGPIRSYFSERYGTQFCESITPDELKRRKALLGKGGVALTILEDGSIFNASTDTNTTLVDVEPLRGSSAMAIGKDNTILHTTDAGITWRKSQLPIAEEVTAIAHTPVTDQIIFSGKHGWIGSTNYSPDPKQLAISQDVLDVKFTEPEPGDTTAPRIISVGREGLIQLAYSNREGWLPARIEDEFNFNDILCTQNYWFAAGNTLMHRGINDNDTWTIDNEPQKTEWTSLLEIPGAVVATGKKGAVARFDLSENQPQWKNWEVDDVPGIDFDANINASAISDDHKTWVAVGDKGSILVAQADENGKFGRIQRISNSYAGYGVVRDIIAGIPAENALYNALHRYTEEDFYDVAYNDGKFYAIGTDSTLMVSDDGFAWEKQQLHIKNKLLRTIRFINKKAGVIAGEKGVMLVTEDGGKTWRSKNSNTERSIYDIATSPAFGNGFVFAGAYGLWGFCESTEGKCLLRAGNKDNHYRAIEFDRTPQKIGNLQLAVAGNDAHIDYIHDLPGSESIKMPFWQKDRSNVTAMAFASADLTLRPNAPQGRVGLIATGNGYLQRSMDGGFTFQREGSGFNSPITKIAMMKNGDVAWIFDGKGNAAQDTYGNGIWEPLKTGFIDGTFAGNKGYLIDQSCVYSKSMLADIEKVACAPQNTKLVSITTDGKLPVLTVKTQGILAKATIEQDQIQIQQDEITSKTDISDHARIIACGGKNAIFDIDKNTLLSSGEPIENVTDAACINGKLTTLTSELIRPGVWNLTANAEDAIWSMEVGFDPASAHFAFGEDSWWLAAEDPQTTNPLILMSHDGKSWSWRRNTINDYHAVDTAGHYAVAVGDNGSILYSSDYGASWAASSVHSNITLRDVCIASDGSFGIAVGDGGTIYRAKDKLSHWAKLKNKLEFDITSCAIAERKSGTQIYLAGKGGAIYTASKEMNALTLISSPVIEDIYSLTALDTGEVIAVGGVYQDPATICDKGFVIEADRSPSTYKLALIIVIIIGLFWLFSLYKLISAVRRSMASEEESA